MGVSRARFVIIEPQKRTGTEEIGKLTEQRFLREWSAEDSTRWVRELKPREEIAWTRSGTRAVVIDVVVPRSDDSVSASVGGNFGLVKRAVPIVAKQGERRFTWNLKDDLGRRVQPGLYSVYFVVRNFVRIFYVVVP
jgi:hypothetical protein